MCMRDSNVRVLVGVLLAGADAGIGTTTIWAGGKPYNSSGLLLESSGS